MPLKVQVAGKTDVGLIRPGNEDFLHLDRANHVFAVCDGMGGHQAGEVASMLAVQTLACAFGELYTELSSQPDPFLANVRLPVSGRLLLRAIRLANRAIFNRAIEDAHLSGMGTTVVALALEDDVVTVAHVGDSRAYRFAERQLEPLTIDHSWLTQIQQERGVTEEEETNPMLKNVITRALGVRDGVEVDFRLVKVRAGDRFLLCSDGLCGYADDGEIFDAAKRAGKGIDHIVNDLVQLANDRGGADNVSVAVVEVLEVGESSYAEIPVTTLPTGEPAQLAVEDIWLERMERQLSQVKAKTPGSSRGRRRLLLGVIFALFVIVAAALIYLGSNQ